MLFLTKVCVLNRRNIREQGKGHSLSARIVHACVLIYVAFLCFIAVYMMSRSHRTYLVNETSASDWQTYDLLKHHSYSLKTVAENAGFPTKWWESVSVVVAPLFLSLVQINTRHEVFFFLYWSLQQLGTLAPTAAAADTIATNFGHYNEPITAYTIKNNYGVWASPLKVVVASRELCSFFYRVQCF